MLQHQQNETTFSKKKRNKTGIFLLPALLCLGSRIFFFGAIGTIHWRSKEEQEEIRVLVFCLTIVCFEENKQKTTTRKEQTALDLCL